MSASRPPLGQVLVEAGLLSEAALREALDEQQRTRRPLGEVLIRQGHVSPAAVANALADQHGGLLRTEYGVATGLRRRSGAEAATPPPPPPALPGAPPAEGNGIADHIAQLARRFGRAPGDAPEEEPLPALRVAGPQPQPPAAEASAPAAPPEPTPDPDLDSVLQMLQTLDDLLADVEQRARDLDELATALERRATAPPQESAPPPAPVSIAQPPDDRHMLLVPTPNGVELVARTGRPPSAGDEMELLVGGEPVRFVVGEIGPAPLPGPYVPCAQLTRV